MLYVPRRAQEQCFGARALDGKLEGLGDAPPLHPPAARSVHQLQGRGWWRDAAVCSVCLRGSVLSAFIPLLYKPADGAFGLCTILRQ